MIGFNFLSDKLEHTKVFYSSGSSSWQPWQKPHGAKNVYIFCIGGGGGGQAGSGGVSETSRAGGSGGAASGYSFGSFSSCLLPDNLYVNVGAGGAGGVGGSSTGANGGAGSISYVSFTTSAAVTQDILISSGNAAAGATNGSVNTPAAGTVWSFASGYIMPFIGSLFYNQGSNGTPAGTGTGLGASVTISNIVTGGAAGGGVTVSTTYPGGNITGGGFFNSILGGGPGGFAGSSGYFGPLNLFVRSPLFFPGGAGGGSINSGSGGEGGSASYGSGGGGGGAGTTGGSGGKGGDGLVIITCW